MKRIRKIIALLGLALLLGLLPAAMGVAIHQDLFELDTRAGVDGDQDKKNDPIPPTVGDGNAADDPAVTGDDWENVYLGTSSAFATTFIEDTFANNNIDNGAEPFVALRTPEDTFFTTGGSKDTNGIQDGPWKYKVVSDQVPDKNDIVNAFAAAYDDEGTTHFYFGLDTFSVNGDANAGFWFFRQPVGLNPLGPGEDTGTFSGVHTDGDIFVAVAYTEGGTVGEIDVYRWVGDDATGSLVLQFSGADCAEGGFADQVCGVINKLLPDQTFGEDPIFDYANTLVANNPLDPTSYQYESAAFVEFGLDVEEVLGGPIGCFTTFLAETRSSQSETAQLKDFAFGAFPICSIDVDKTGDTLSKVGDDVDYQIVVTNTGRATLYKQSIVDTVFGDLTDGTNPLITSSDCGASLAPDASCTINVTRTVQAGDPDPLDNTVTIVYTEFADPTSLSFTDSDNHSVNLFQPAVQVVKEGDTLSKIDDPVDYTITVTNLSSADSPDLINGTIVDTLLGDLLDGANPFVTNSDCSATLATGASCTIEATRIVQAGDPDPLPNTVTVHFNPEGFPNDITDSDDHTVELFQPAVDVMKDGDTLSKVGDPVDYTITVTNMSSADSPDLINGTIVDTLLGDLLDGANPFVTSNTCGATLPTGGSCLIEATRTVQAGDPDPLPNTVTVSYNPEGFPNDISDSDGHEVNLFQPSITFEKTGTLLSKLGDPVDYTITLSNTSSADTPDLECTIMDVELGVDAFVTLASGESEIINESILVPGDASDPYINMASASCSPIGFPNVLDADDSHSVNLFQPSVDVTKTGDMLSKIGDPVSYTITVENTSSDDSPDLINGTIVDTLLGDLLDGANPFVTNSDCSATLATGASCTIEATRTVQAGDPDPLPNTVTVHFNPEGFENDITDSDDHEVELFQPSVDVTKTGDTLSKIDDPVSYTITVENTSSADSPDLVNGTIVDTLLGDLLDGANLFVTSNTCSATLATGASCTIEATRTVQAGDPDPLPNTVTVHFNPEGFENDITDSDDHTVELFQPSVQVIKGGDTLSKVGDPVDYTITVNNTSSLDSPNLVNGTIVDTLLGDLLDAANPFVTSNTCSATLAPGASCTIEATRTVQAGDPDPLPNTVTAHFNPDGFPNDISDSDDHEVNLFQPSITFEKTGTALSKIGDPVAYTIALNNTSSGDTPDLECTISDALFGLNKMVTLASGESDVTNLDETVPEGASDPFVNTASVSCSPIGFPNVLNASDDHSTNLFQPSVTVTKTGPTMAFVGDMIQYNFTIENTSSGDTPNLILDSVTDTVLGDITGAASSGGCGTLASGGSCNFAVPYTVMLSDPDILYNVVTVHYHPDGFTNDITDDDDHSLQVFRTMGQLTPTGTECFDFSSGMAQDQEILSFNASGGTINSVNPGAFIYWSEIIAPSPAFTVHVTQSANPAFTLIALSQDGPKLFDASCNRVQTVTVVPAALGQAEIQVMGAIPGATYYLTTKYDSNSLKNEPIPGSDITYTFETVINGDAFNGDSLILQPK